MNVLCICADTFRADYLGCYGNDWIVTPNLDALAAEGIVFEQAYAEALPTLPARRVFFTGRRVIPRWQAIPHKGDHLGFQPAWHAIPEDEVTVAELLEQAGVLSAFITDVYHYFKPTGNFHRGFTVWEFIRGQEADRWRSGPAAAIDARRQAEAEMDAEAFALSSLPGWCRTYLLNTADRRREEDYFVARVMRAAAQWLEDNADRRPWLLWVDCFDPHEPWDPPLRDADRYYAECREPNLIFAPASTTSAFTEPQMRRIVALYAGEVTLVDRWVGYLLRRLEELGLADDTAVIFTTDHGTLLGELGAVHKQPWGLIQPETRLPMIMRVPGSGLSGLRVAEYVQAFDLMPTVLDLLDVPVPGWVEGRNMLDVARGTVDGHQEVVSAFGAYASLRTRTHNYVAPYMPLEGTHWERNRQPPRLFTLDDNLCEADEVSADEPELAEELQARLEEAVAADRWK